MRAKVLVSTAVLVALAWPLAPLTARGLCIIPRKDVISINAKVRFSTLIVLPANEEILDYTTGDKDYWIINEVHGLCYLHPPAEGIKADLILVTASGHVYSFLRTEISKVPGAQPDLKVFVVREAGSSLARTADPADPPKCVRASVADAYCDPG